MVQEILINEYSYHQLVVKIKFRNQRAFYLVNIVKNKQTIK